MDTEMAEAMRVAEIGGKEAARQVRQFLMSLRRVREERDQAVMQLTQAKRALLPMSMRRG